MEKQELHNKAVQNIVEDAKDGRLKKDNLEKAVKAVKSTGKYDVQIKVGDYWADVVSSETGYSDTDLRRLKGRGLLRDK